MTIEEIKAELDRMSAEYDAAFNEWEQGPLGNTAPVWDYRRAEYLREKIVMISRPKLSV